MTDTMNVRDLYSLLRKRLEKRARPFSLLNVLVRMNEGVRKQHSYNILCLYWWHVFLTDRPLYSRLKAATDEATMRQILGGRVMTSYVQGEKTITLYSNMFPAEFFEIIDAYIDYTDELSH